MATLQSVVKKWELLSSKVRNGRLAKAMAKTIVLKAAGICGKKYLKSMGEAKFLYVMWKAKSQKHFNSVYYEDEIWKYQPKEKTYHPDFTLRVGYSIHTIEYKGKMDGKTRTKMKDIKRCNPIRSLIMVFERGRNKISPRSKTTYMAWAKQNGFPAFDVQDKYWKRDLLIYLKENSQLIKGGEKWLYGQRRN